MVGVASRYMVGGGNLKAGDKGAGEKKGWETGHPRAPAVRILSPQPSCPNTPGPAPLSPCSVCLGPSRLPSSFFFPHPHLHLCLGSGAPEEEGAMERERVGEGNSRGALTALQPQPPHPHDLHRKGAPGWGRRGTDELCAGLVIWAPGPRFQIVPRPALTSDLCPD